MKPMHPLLARILPYLMIAFMLVIFVVGIFIFSYVLLFVIVVGFIFFMIGWIRAKFFSHGKTNTIHEEFIVDVQRTQTRKPGSSSNAGRLIEHDEEPRG